MSHFQHSGTTAIDDTKMCHMHTNMCHKYMPYNLSTLEFFSCELLALQQVCCSSRAWPCWIARGRDPVAEPAGEPVCRSPDRVMDTVVLKADRFSADPTPPRAAAGAAPLLVWWHIAQNIEVAGETLRGDKKILGITAERFAEVFFFVCLVDRGEMGHVFIATVNKQLFTRVMRQSQGHNWETNW